VVEQADHQEIVGCIYKGVVKNFVSSINGLFVDIGIGRNAFLRTKDLPPGPVPSSGSAVLVQVVKDGTETKGPLVTGRVSLSGKYAVALSNTDYIGVSKKIKKEEIRKSLREGAKQFLPSGMGLIIRTAAEKADAESFERDIEKLAGNFDVIQKRFRREKAPALLFRSDDLAVRALRDYYSGADEFLVDDAKTFERLRSISEEEKILSPEILKFHSAREPLLKTDNADEQIRALFEREVPLPSGGSLVIDYTEALTAIDVNSGSFKGQGIPHGELAFLINREAAKEIARQIRLRGIGGMILVDFIDMDEEEQKEEIVSELRRAVAHDRVKTVVLGMTSLGLVEMTRKRTVHRLWQNYFDACPVCGGSGRQLSAAAVVTRIENELLHMAATGQIREDILVRCHPSVKEILETDAEMEFLSQALHHNIRAEGSGHQSREVYSILADE